MNLILDPKNPSLHCKMQMKLWALNYLLLLAMKKIMAQETSTKQHLSAALKIRELILQGSLAPGQRITESALAELLGISRTPVRQALPALAQDGLLTPVGKQGYAVRAFTAEESYVALEARAALEGLAGRAAAERGLQPHILEQFKECLAIGDKVLQGKRMTADTKFAYGEMNDRFHRLILEAAERPLLAELVMRCEMVPFVSPAAVAFRKKAVSVVFEDLVYAHHQHRYIVDALVRKEAARVEALIREHALTQRHSMNL